MDRVFSNAQLFNGDCFVADYSEQSKKTGENKKVVLSSEELQDISTFHLRNPRGIEYWGVNFEKNDAFFHTSGKKVRQCECMFVSKHAKHKAWACFIELKYCQSKNIESNSDEAYEQLFSTLSYLIQKGVLNKEDYRFYLNYSSPDHSNREPFFSFKFSPSERLKYRKEFGIQILGYNQVLILNEAYIQVPQEDI